MSAPGAIIGRNARFTVYINGADVRITLRPGQMLSHHWGHATDEGYDSGSDTWKHEGDHISWQWGTDGRDCDGRLSHGGESTATELTGNRVENYSEPDSDYPVWQSLHSYQHDYRAEAAGY